MVQIKRILCPIDFSECSLRALHQGMALARRYGASLTVLHVFTNLPNLEIAGIPLDDPDHKLLIQRMQVFTGDVPPDLKIRFVARCVQEVSAEILAQAEEADLVVIGSHGRSGFNRLLLGSATEKVVRKATRPIMVVPPHLPPAGSGLLRGTPPHIVCAIDFSAASLGALTYAISLAEQSAAQLTLFHSIEVPPELLESIPLPAEFNIEQAHAEARAGLLQRLRELVPSSTRERCEVKTHVDEGMAYRQLLRLAVEQPIDLIVMGVQGRGAVDLLLFGSNTARVIRAATCPVLIVPVLPGNAGARPTD
ncbi:MAG: universal stress protein [Acidobacteria bacterium]|nr:universal stress protein [Acidobacteriota bacterium]